jgi:uncharacterized protein YodC (DUF2158 family)
MSANFKIGDLVRLKCGSPAMCINSLLLDYHGQGEESRKCYWVMYYAPGSYTAKDGELFDLYGQVDPF